MRLILMRHCKSSWDMPDLADHDRPLNRRGTRSATALGRWLRDKAYLPDHALVSTALRTRETFAGLQLDCPVTYSGALYHAAPDGVLRLIEATGDEVRTLLVIGHNPGFADLAWRLARRPVVHPRFGDYPTGATTVFDCDIRDWVELTWGMAKARDFVIPRALLEPEG